jgi:hypothetical protein
VSFSKPVPAALMVKHMPNERLMATEARHVDIALHDLGGDEITDDLNSVTWSICGKEYMVLVDNKDMVRDVRPFPAHSKATPAFSGFCSRNGHDFADPMVGILDNSNTTAASLPAKAAWRNDTHKARFVYEPVAGLMCPRSGVIVDQ